MAEQWRGGADRDARSEGAVCDDCPQPGKRHGDGGHVMSPDTSGSPRPERAQADSQEERRADVGNQCDGLAGRSLYGNNPHHVRHGVEKAGHIPLGQKPQREGRKCYCSSAYIGLECLANKPLEFECASLEGVAFFGNIHFAVLHRTEGDIGFADISSNIDSQP